MSSTIFYRIISAVVIGAIFITALVQNTTLFYILTTALFLGMSYEWVALTKNTSYLYLGLLIIPIPIASLIGVKIMFPDGRLLLAYFIGIWIVDTFAMIGGKIIGGKKLCPSLSPNKTYSGLFVGSFASGIALHFLGSIYMFMDVKIATFLFGVINALISQSSDLFMSYFKRKFKVKDFSSLIPGHGGVLDRFDSIILTSPLLFLYLYI